MNDSRDPGSVAGAPAEIRVLFEDAHFIFIGKPAGVIVHRLNRHAPRPSDVVLTDWLLARYPEIGSVGDDPAVDLPTGSVGDDPVSDFPTGSVTGRSPAGLLRWGLQFLGWLLPFIRFSASA